MQRMDPDYRGFRGYAEEPSLGNVPLESVSCTICGRTRNVPRGIAVEQRDSYVCSSCLEKQNEETQGASQVESASPP
jgi:hypothetical protein